MKTTKKQPENTKNENFMEENTMKTNNEKINLSELFKKAHEMTRKTLKKYPGADYRVTFGAALKVLRREAGKTARELWEDYSDEEKAALVRGLAWYEHKIDGARPNPKTGGFFPPVFAWIQPANLSDCMEDVIQESWTYLLRDIDNPRFADRALSRIVSRAVIKAAKKVQAAAYRNGAAIITRTNDAGEEYDVIDTEAGRHFMAGRIDGPEAETIAADTIWRACHDETDRVIAAYLYAGYKAREIARALDLSHTAVNKRIKGLRERAAQ